MDTPKKPAWQPVLFLAIGLLIGTLGTLLVQTINTLQYHVDHFGDPVVLTDGEVRAKIIEQGVALPIDAYKLYYFFQNGKDYIELISFNASAEECRATAEAYLKQKAKGPAKLTPGTGPSEFSMLAGLPAGIGKQWETPLWDFSTVKHGLMHEEDYLFVLIDTDHNRVFIASWST